MVFHSFSFLASFAALVAVYYAVPHRYQWPLLLVSSLCFYATFDPRYLLPLLLVAAAAYTSALGIHYVRDPRRKQLIMAAGIVASLAPLVVLKYYDFFAGALVALLARLGLAAVRAGPDSIGLAVPGLSFYTLSCVAYVAGVYAGRLPAARHAGQFALYVSFFPRLLAGPIEPAAPFLAQIARPVTFDAARVTQGLQLMLWGLFKKVVIADRLATFVDGAYRQPAFAPAADLVIATYLFAFQLYCDFSGYSDIAIGASKVLGIDLMENFRRPFFAKSVPEFWAQRWHLSLTRWFRDCLYIPMGGSRVSRARLAVNIMAVFLVSGLWHGASWTFVVWGGLNGLCCVASALGGQRRKPAAFLGPLLTFHLILVTWVFFRAGSLADATTILWRVAASLPALPDLIWARLSGELWLSFGLIAFLLGAEALDENQPLWERLRARPVYLRWAVYYALLFGLITLGNWNLRRFVYMQF